MIDKTKNLLDELVDEEHEVFISKLEFNGTHISIEAVIYGKGT